MLLSNIQPVFEKLLKKNTVFLFQGHVGAGKTFLIRWLLEYNFGVKNAVSPTFAYLKKYHLETGLVLNHFDLYRLKGFEGFADLGFWQDLTEDGSITFLEWPEIVFGTLSELFLAKNVYLVRIYSDGEDFEGCRELELFRLHA